VLPLLRAAQGTVVFIGSGASTRPVPGSAVYAATKHALRAVSDVLRIDEEPHRLRVVTVAPGQTDTEMLRSMVPDEHYAPERYIRPESVAGAVRFVVDAPADVQITDIAVRPRQEINRI
jgi:NADP-dependent 3-hydroxy acid dehydrogenase YdfG